MPNIDDGEPPREQPTPNAHTLTLMFHRVLDEEEWRAVVKAARDVPFVQELVANAVVETQEELVRRFVARFDKLRQACTREH